MPNSIRPLALCLILAAAASWACVPPQTDESAAGGASGGAPGASGGSGAGNSPTGSGGSGNPGNGNAGGSAGSIGGGSSGGSGGTAPTTGQGGAGLGSGGNPGSGSGGNGATQADAGGQPSGGDASAALPGGPAKPSAGCGKMNPASGARTIMTGGKTANFIVTLPAGYDAAQPQPLGFAFHGYGLNEKTCAAGSECPGYKDLKAITVYPKSIGAGWEYPLNLLGPNIQFFEDMVAHMKAEYCVDENRIFVAGVSSGGQFVEHLSCKFGDWLWAVSPIAAYVDKGVDVACKGTPAQVIIHGITDNLVKNAHAVRDLFTKRNGCPTPPAMLEKAETDMKAARAANRAEYVCLDYEGCAKAPVRYCVFSQVTYNGLTHGWPKVGGKLIEEFLATLK